NHTVCVCVCVCVCVWCVCVCVCVCDSDHRGLDAFCQVGRLNSLCLVKDKSQVKLHTTFLPQPSFYISGTHTHSHTLSHTHTDTHTHTAFLCAVSHLCRNVTLVSKCPSASPPGYVCVYAPTSHSLSPFT